MKRINPLISRKKDMYRILFLFALLSISICGQAQLTLNNVTLPAKLNYHEETLVLNGGGIRSKLFFKLYTIGLYLPSKSANVSAILSSDEMLAVRFEITSDMINSDNMSEAINEGFDKSTNGYTKTIRTRIDHMLKTFSSEAIVLGDLFDLVYVADKGTEIYKNGLLKTTIQGKDFKKAVFGIWLGEKPINSGLKKDLVGH